MQLLNHNRITYNIPQQFFVEKVLEMLHKGTIDTYRARVMNPKTIIEEICDLIKGRIKGRIPNNKAMLYAIQEAKNLLETEETYLNFSPFSKQKITSIIGQLHEESLPVDKLKKILIVLKDFYVNHNKDYCKILLIKIREKIDSYDDAKSLEENFEILDEIATLTNFYITELLYIGFTKRFLYRKFSNEFNSKDTRSFAHSFDNITKVVDYSLETYQVIFKLEIPTDVVENLNPIPDVSIISDISEYITGNGRSLTEEVKSFASKKQRQTHYYLINVSARDVFQALNKARINFAENMDLIHLGYSEQEITTWEKVLIINKQFNNSNFYTIQPVAYSLDGQFKDGNTLYKSFVEAINRIQSNPDIKNDTKEKIKSSVRYLRLGNTALEVEHKFINYWFALEHLFSDALTDNNDNSINKIKRSFPKIHCTIFIKRILKDFHDNIDRLKVSSSIPTYSAEIDYLKDSSTYDYIITNLSSSHPLLAFRAIKIKKALFTPPTGPKKSILSDRVKRHKQDLEWHLARMYRIRNSIVHDASSGKNIISITANLKYYLIFIISHTIKILENHNSLQSIEDLLALSEEMYDSLENELFPLNKIFQITTHFDFID